MVQAMDHEAVDDTSDGSRSIRRRYGSGSCRRVPAMEGAIDGTSDGSGSCRRSGGWCKRLHERQMVQAMDQDAVEGDMDQKAVEGCKRWKER